MASAIQMPFSHQRAEYSFCPGEDFGRLFVISVKDGNIGGGPSPFSIFKEFFMRMSGLALCVLPVLLIPEFAAAAPPKNVPPSQVIIATLGDEKITLSDLDTLIEGLPEKIRGMARMRRKDIFDSLLNRRLIFRQAEKLGIGDRKAVRDYVARARREIMIREVMSDLNKKWSPTAAEVKEEYERNKKNFHRLGKVTASHIMVVSEKEAK
jgi:hypothetical protein